MLIVHRWRYRSLMVQLYCEMVEGLGCGMLLGSLDNATCERYGRLYINRAQYPRIRVVVCENTIQNGEHHRDYLRQSIAKRIDPLVSSVRQQDT